MLDKVFINKLCEKMVSVRLKTSAVERRVLVEKFKKQSFCHKEILEIVEVLLLTSDEDIVK